jgi:hypothetical protein
VDDTTTTTTATSTKNNYDTHLKGGRGKSSGGSSSSSSSSSSRGEGGGKIDKPSGEIVQTGRLMRYKGIKVAIERKNLTSSSSRLGSSSSSRGSDGGSGRGGGGTNTWLRITCTEGKNRQLRRILESMGLDVTRLIRISYGDYDLNTIPPGMAIEVPYKQLHEMKKRGPLFATKNSRGNKRIMGNDNKSVVTEEGGASLSSKVEWINYS